ncbi:MAG: YceI family protein [Deltaproteobacteria bacterium]|nr:YceI family protein [Deltaproteobacteria bacterium]
MNGSYRFALALAATLALPALCGAATWNLDPSHSTAEFKVRHLMVSNVRGEFRKVAGTVAIDDQEVTRSVMDVTIEAASIDTADAKRDEHLKSADFFDVTRFPTITFKSKQVQKAGKGKLKVKGDLTMHGVTREAVLDVEGPTAPVKDPWGATRVGASATAKVNRKDYGLSWNKTLEGGGVLVGEEVSIHLAVELVKAANQGPVAKN